jgi:hypothetical protein
VKQAGERFPFAAHHRQLGASIQALEAVFQAMGGDLAKRRRHPHQGQGPARTGIARAPAGLMRGQTLCSVGGHSAIEAAIAAAQEVGEPGHGGGHGYPMPQAPATIAGAWFLLQPAWAWTAAA